MSRAEGILLSNAMPVVDAVYAAEPKAEWVSAGPRRSAEHVRPALRQVEEYLSGERTSFDLPIDLSWTSAFQRQVLQAALAIPRGQTRTYHQMARRIGRRH